MFCPVLIPEYVVSLKGSPWGHHSSPALHPQGHYYKVITNYGFIDSSLKIRFLFLADLLGYVFIILEYDILKMRPMEIYEEPMRGLFYDVIVTIILI